MYISCPFGFTHIRLCFVFFPSGEQGLTFGNGKVYFSNPGVCFPIHRISVEAIPLSPGSLPLLLHTKTHNCRGTSLRTSFLLNVQERSTIHCVLRGLNFTTNGKAVGEPDGIFYFILYLRRPEKKSASRGCFRFRAEGESVTPSVMFPPLRCFMFCV